jgi:hypothetical protein
MGPKLKRESTIFMCANQECFETARPKSNYCTDKCRDDEKLRRNRKYKRKIRNVSNKCKQCEIKYKRRGSQFCSDECQEKREKASNSRTQIKRRAGIFTQKSKKNRKNAIY